MSLLKSHTGKRRQKGFECLKKSPLFYHSGSSPATTAVKAEGKQTPFWTSKLQISFKSSCSDEGSQRCPTSSSVFNSWRRKAALVNRPQRVLWKLGSMRRASQVEVSASAWERKNNHIETQKLWKTPQLTTYHIWISQTYILTVILTS